TYTLTATNAAGNVTQTAQVTVSAVGTPVINSFVATPASIFTSQSSTLSWSVTGATSLTIDQSIGDVTGLTSTVVMPAATTTYRLTATNAAGSVTVPVTVVVSAMPKPTINSFVAAPTTITVGGSSTLTWSVTGATTVSIDNGVGTVTGTTSTV